MSATEPSHPSTAGKPALTKASANEYATPGREIKQPPLDKWIGTACEVAEQIGSLFVKFVFQHGSPNNPDYTSGSLSQVSFDRRMVERTKSGVSSGGSQR
jgi:hypothetical protein